MQNYASKIYYDITIMNTADPEERYENITAAHKDFVMSFPLIVKYMCNYMYDAEIFADFIKTRESQRVSYDDGFKLQTVYIKKLLIKKGLSRIDAKKAANLELDAVMREINSVKREERNFKRDQENDRKQAMRELRKEFKTAVTDMCASDEPLSQEELEQFIKSLI